jgi:hypothetical protein
MGLGICEVQEDSLTPWQHVRHTPEYSTESMTLLTVVPRKE